MTDLALFCGIFGLLFSVVAVIASVVDHRQQRRDRRQL